MTMFYCKLIGKQNRKDSVVIESLYREGNSEEEVKEGLEMFEWPAGRWVIEIA